MSTVVLDQPSWIRRPRAVRHARSLAALLLLLATSAATVAAQTATSNVRGYVRTDDGRPVADAQVSARSVETNQTRTVTTSANGYYFIGGLRPGSYAIAMRRLGVSPQTRTLQLLIGQTLDLNFATAEAVAQLGTVTVRAEAEGTESRTSEVGTNVTRDQIDNLPNYERNFLDIAKLAPGITPSAVGNNDKVFAAGGQPAEAVNIFVDGASYKNDVLRGGVIGQDASKGNPFPQAAVQEFRVITQNYKAEYQKAGSAIITATTRSGTNEWESDVFAYRVDKAHVARNAVELRDAQPAPNFSRLQAGGSAGGPLRADKLFFFGTYEYNGRDEPQTVRVGSNIALAPASLNLNSYAGRFVSEFREHLGFGKLTWIRSDRTTADASFTLRKENDFRGFGGQTSFESAEDVAINVLNAVANWKHAGDRWLNESQVNAQRFIWNPRPKNPELVGREFAGIIRVGGREGRQEFTQDRISLRHDATRSALRFAGDHTIKGGASVDFLGYEGVKDFFFTTPLYILREQTGYTRPSAALFGFGDPDIGTRNTQLGAYVQDDWNVTSKLVINLGLRWDAETNMINNSYRTPQPLADSLRALESQLVVQQPVPGGPARVVPIMEQLGGLDRYLTRGREDRPMYKKAFQPRLGASYDLRGDGGTVLFGGFGIYYDRNYWNTLFDEQFRRQFRILFLEFRDDCAAGQFGCARWDERYYDPAQLRTLGFNVSPEVFLVANDLKPPKTHQFSGGVRQQLGRVLLTASYNGIRGFNGMNYVRVSPWGGFAPNYNTIFATDDRVKTFYNSVQLQLERPFRENERWGGSIAYTLAKSEEQGQSQDIFWGFDDRYPTVADRPRLRAPGDQRHTVVANAVVRLPADIRFSTIVNLGSGIAFNATDASGGWGPFEQRTYTFAPPARAFLGVGNAFATQNADFRIEKGVRIGRGQDVSISADLYNAFNSANFGCYDATIFPTSGSPNTNFGKPFCASQGRRLQIGLRYGHRGTRGAAAAAGEANRP